MSNDGKHQHRNQKQPAPQAQPAATAPEAATPQPAVRLAPVSPIKVQAAPTAYRVTRGGSFAMHGQICYVKEGHVVKVSAYGKEGLDRMLGCGITLEPIAG